MPLPERICWNCNLPVDKENVYKIPTLCQCVRSKCCRQHVDDGHSPDCETKKKPVVPPQGTQATSINMDEWIRETQERLARLSGQGQGPIEMPASPTFEPVFDPISIVPTPTRQGIHQFMMLDAMVEMDNPHYQVPCRMMDAWVVGQASTSSPMPSIPGINGQVPGVVQYQNVRFNFMYHMDTQKVHLTYEGINERAEPQIFTTIINFADMQRWVTRYHERMR